MSETQKLNYRINRNQRLSVWLKLKNVKVEMIMEPFIGITSCENTHAHMKKVQRSALANWCCGVATIWFETDCYEIILDIDRAC